jgi:hypothetical protein
MEMSLNAFNQGMRGREVKPMTENEFLATNVPNCTCGNKVKPRLHEWRDMGAIMNCPEIKCYYCDLSAGSFYPEEFKKCLDSWESLVEL